MRAHLSSWRGSPVHWVSIETGLTQAGVPDLHGTCRGASTWVECKSADAWALGIGTMQIGFARAEIACGGRVVYITRRRPTAAKRRGEDSLWLCDGAEVRALSVLGLRCPAAVRLGDGGPEGWDWDILGIRLFG